MAPTPRPPNPWPYIGLSLSIIALLPFIVGHPWVYSHIPAEWRPKPVFKPFMGIPVLTDKSSMLFASISMVLGLLPLYLYARRGYRWRERLLEQTRDFLQLYAGIIRTMENTSEALLATARLTRPPISLLAERMARLYRVRGDIDEAFRDAFSKAPREVKLLISSIPAALKAGGARGLVLEKAARYASQLHVFRRAIEARMAEYTAVVALAVITYAAAASIVLGLVQTLGASQLPLASAKRIDIDFMRGVFFYSIIVLALSSSMVIGKTIRGYLPLASKYAMLLIASSTLILLFLHIP
ncbi:MAG: type II secretion system F family protein [Pyrodictiaceae archaeon]